MRHKITVLTTSNEQLTGAQFIDRGLSRSDAIGIVVQTDTIGLLLSLDEWRAPWGDYHLITSEKGDSQNLMELSGLELTKQIVTVQETRNIDVDTAAKLCWKYGKYDRQWYLPCCYELATICAYSNEINNVMRKIGVPVIERLKLDYYYWSSSEINSGSAVLVNFSSGNLNLSGKYNNLYVRAVSAFSPLNSFNPLVEEQSDETTFNPSILSDEQIIEELHRRNYTGTLQNTITIIV